MDFGIRAKMIAGIIPFVPIMERGHRSIKDGKHSCPQGCRKEENHLLDLEAKERAAESFLPDIDSW